MYPLWIFFLLWVYANPVFSEAESVRANDKKTEERLLQKSDTWSPSMGSLNRWFFGMVPAFVDQALANAVGALFQVESGQRFIMSSLFSSRNKDVSKYDSYGVYSAIPLRPIPLSKIHALVDAASSEKLNWEGGRMSGGNYDGTPEHRKKLAQIFRSYLDTDPQNSMLYPDLATQELVQTVFEEFNVANPLHSLFPLAIKAMRETAAMFGSLVGSRYGIINSGGREAIRIGLRAMKNQRIVTEESKPARLLIIDDPSTSGIARIASTLNLQSETTESKQLLSLKLLENKVPFDFAVLHLHFDNLSETSEILRILKQRFPSIQIHLHLSNTVFRRLLLAKDDVQFLKTIFRNTHIHSLSYESSGLIYAGVSATIFANNAGYTSAFESHVEWLGGGYPGINTAGSLPGINYILAYVLILSHGRSGLEELALTFQSEDFPYADSLRTESSIPSSYQKALVQKLSAIFSREKKDSTPQSSSPSILADEVAMELANFRRKQSIPDREWRSTMESVLVGVALPIFGANTEDYAAKVTSGGTESLRLAMQIYLRRFRRANPDVQPVILMSRTAHVALDRHCLDNDVKIVRIPDEREHGSIDIEALEKLIAETPNIAAIVASTPSYPMGSVDDIERVAQIAYRSKIPLHVDSCLGAFVMQFLPNNPVRLDFANPRWIGVSSWSADIHKYGTTQKGLSFLGMRRSMLEHDTDAFESICAPVSATNLATGLTCLLEIGARGYEERALNIARVGQQLRSELAMTDGINLLAVPRENVPSWVVAFQLAEPLQDFTYTLDEMLKQFGWHLSRVSQQTLHIAVTQAHVQQADFIPHFMHNLKFCIELIRSRPQMSMSVEAALYGASANLPTGIGGPKTAERILAESLRLYAMNVQTLQSQATHQGDL